MLRGTNAPGAAAAAAALLLLLLLLVGATSVKAHGVAVWMSAWHGLLFTYLLQ